MRLETIPLFDPQKSISSQNWIAKKPKAVFLGIEDNFDNGLRTMMFTDVVNVGDCRPKENADRVFCTKADSKQHNADKYDIGTPLLYCDEGNKLRAYGVMIHTVNVGTNSLQLHASLEKYISFIDEVRKKDTANVEVACESLPYHARNTDIKMSFMVRLVSNLPVNKISYFMGSLIHPQFVLTSAKAILSKLRDKKI